MNKIIAIFLPHQGLPATLHLLPSTAYHRHCPATETTRRMCVNPLNCALAEPKSRQKKALFEVAFYGGTFTGLALETQERFLQAVSTLYQYGRHHRDSPFDAPAYVQCPDFGAAHDIRRSSCGIGVQSFDDEVLRFAQRGHTAEEAELMIRQLQAAGIETGIPSDDRLPGDSRAKSLFSAHKAIELRPACCPSSSDFSECRAHNWSDFITQVNISH
jgi:hypothetical protein